MTFNGRSGDPSTERGEVAFWEGNQITQCRPNV